MSVTKLVETLIVSLSEFLSKLGNHLRAPSGIMEKEHFIEAGKIETLVLASEMLVPVPR